MADFLIVGTPYLSAYQNISVQLALSILISNDNSSISMISKESAEHSLSEWTRLVIRRHYQLVSFYIEIHPCEKVVGIFFQNQIWSRLLDINRLCLICIERSIEEVKRCQISKRGYEQGPSHETLKKARYQFCDVKFGHRIMVAVGLFDYKMCNLP